MKPRAMSLWIVAAASSAFWPRRSVQARVSFSPAVKNVIRSSSSRRRLVTSPSADGRPPGTPPPPRRAARRARPRARGRSPPARSRSRAAASSSAARARAGSSPGHSASVLPSSRCASSRSSSAASARSVASPDFACFATRSRRRSTWSRSATSSSSFSVSRSAAGSRVPLNASSTTSSASTWRRLPSSCGAGARHVDHAHRRGRDLLRADDVREPVEPLVGDRGHADVLLPELARAPSASARGTASSSPTTAARRCRPRAPRDGG